MTQIGKSSQEQLRLTHNQEDVEELVAALEHSPIFMSLPLDEQCQVVDELLEELEYVPQMPSGGVYGTC